MAFVRYPAYSDATGFVSLPWKTTLLDFLSIYAGDSIHSPMVASITGHSPLALVTIAAKDLTFFFQSDQHMSRKAWKVPYTYAACPNACTERGVCSLETVCVICCTCIYFTFLFYVLRASRLFLFLNCAGTVFMYDRVYGYRLFYWDMPKEMLQ